jgi:hypothetical protein
MTIVIWIVKKEKLKMKKGIFFLAMLGFAMIGLIIVSYQNHEVQAQSLDPNGPQVIRGLQNLTMEPSKTVPKAPNATVIPDRQMDNAEQKTLTVLLDELRAKALEAYPSSKSGWYLFKWSQNDDSDAKDNGTNIPQQYTQEMWCYVDPNGMVVQRVTLLKTSQGVIFQVDVNDGQKGWNSVSGEKLPGRIYPFSNLFVGAYKSVTKASQLSPAVVQTVRLNGKEFVKISFTEKYIEPLKKNNFAKQVVQSEKDNYFDMETGLSTIDETISTFVDGTQRTGISSELLSIEIVSGPSEEALKFLKELETK